MYLSQANQNELRHEALQRSPAWYAIKRKPRQEGIAQINLSRACIAVSLPQVKELRVIRRKKALCQSAVSRVSFCEVRSHL
jgi:hypothetical protein